MDFGRGLTVDVRPTPNPITNKLIDNSAISSVVLNSSATPAIPGVITAEANATAKHTKLTVMVTSLFRHRGQLCGCAGSVEEKVMSL